MSTKSIFKFIIRDVEKTKEIIDSIIVNYLEQNNFSYNNNEKCYIIGNPSEKDANINMAASIVSSIPSIVSNHGLVIYSNLHQCFEYEIIGNQLIIRACVLNAFSNIKAYIHSKVNSNMAGREYYNNLQTKLFNELKQNNIILSSIETEKVKDGSTSKLLRKMFLIVVPIIILFTIITICAYYSSH